MDSRLVRVPMSVLLGVRALAFSLILNVCWSSSSCRWHATRFRLRINRRARSGLFSSVRVIMLIRINLLSSFGDCVSCLNSLK